MPSGDRLDVLHTSEPEIVLPCSSMMRTFVAAECPQDLLSRHCSLVTRLKNIARPFRLILYASLQIPRVNIAYTNIHDGFLAEATLWHGIRKALGPRVFGLTSARWSPQPNLSKIIYTAVYGTKISNQRFVPRLSTHAIFSNTYYYTNSYKHLHPFYRIHRPFAMKGRRNRTRDALQRGTGSASWLVARDLSRR